MYDELKDAIREYLGTEKVSAEDGRKLINRCEISPKRFIKKTSDIAEFYLQNEQEIKALIEDHGEKIEDIEDAVIFTFEVLCEEMEEEAAIIDEMHEYDDEGEEQYDNSY